MAPTGMSCLSTCDVTSSTSSIVDCITGSTSTSKSRSSASITLSNSSSDSTGSNTLTSGPQSLPLSSALSTSVKSYPFVGFLPGIGDDTAWRTLGLGSSGESAYVAPSSPRQPLPRAPLSGRWPCRSRPGPATLCLAWSKNFLHDSTRSDAVGNLLMFRAIDKTSWRH